MGPLDHWISKFRTLEKALESSLDVNVRNELETMADLQREQLSEGKNADGGLLKRKEGPYPYSNEYKRKKARMGKQTEFVDLKLSGDYHEGIKATRIGKNRVQMHSVDYKNRFLPGQYSGVFGFDSKRREKLKEVFSRGLKFSVYQHFLA